MLISRTIDNQKVWNSTPGTSIETDLSTGTTRLIIDTNILPNPATIVVTAENKLGSDQSFALLQINEPQEPPTKIARLEGKGCVRIFAEMACIWHRKNYVIYWREWICKNDSLSTLFTKIQNFPHKNPTLQSTKNSTNKANRTHESQSHLRDECSKKSCTNPALNRRA